LEREFEPEFFKEVEKRFNCFVMPKNDSGLRQGIPDRTVLFDGGGWAVLEMKASRKKSYRPNQEYYLEIFDRMCFSATVYPENAEDTLRELEKAFPHARR
jgi:hypothetical protein